MVIFKTNRTYYGATQAEQDSITVGELIEILERFKPKEKVVFSNDNGYTYGYINENVIKTHEL